MRETAKSVDDRPMRHGPCGELGVIEACHQRDAASLRWAILRVFEREIEKRALGFGEPPIKTARDGFLCQRERDRIARKRRGRTTKHIARHLIEDDHCRERASLIAEEFLLRAQRERCMQVEEAAGYSRVEGGIVLEPLFGLSFLKPELQDFAHPGLRRRRGHWRSGTALCVEALRPRRTGGWQG